MRSFGRVIDTTGFQRGGLMDLEGAPPATYPSINPLSLHNALEMFMNQRGEQQLPPDSLIYTRSAAGGCVPICAAEITAPRTVEWIYLMHAHGGNNPRNVSVWAEDLQNVYVCMMVYSGAAGWWGAQHMQSTFFEALDPTNVIPDANALLIYGPHTSLAITRQARIAVDISP
jgi:hypothetical protein